MISSHVDPKHLVAFISVLKRAKEFTGQLGQQNIWYDVDPSDSNDPSKLLDELKVLKAHKETMLRLRKSLKKRISLLQEPCNAITRQIGIKTLPPEILSSIFLLSCVGSEENQQTIHLSHVCRQFRNIALQTTALWTHLDTERPLPEMKEFLRRSGTSPLNITCRAGDWTEELPEFLANISSHSFRWSEIDLRLEWPTADGFHNDAREHGLAFYHPNLPLPNLTSIHHTFFDYPFESQWQPWFDMPWSLPSLQSYTAVNVMPESEFFSGSLTRCNLAWKCTSADDDSNHIDLVSLIHTLHGLKALHHLSLSFTDIPYEYQHIELAPVALPNVATFVLVAKGWVGVARVVESLLSNLKFPNLDNLSWSVHATRELDTDFPRLFHIYSDPFPSAKLRQLHLADNRPGSLNPIVDIIRHCTSLVDLTWCIPNAELFLQDHYLEQRRQDTFMRRSHLQTLTLKNCDAVSRDDIRYLIKALRRGPNWDTFRRLEVNSCKRLTEDFLLALEDEAEGMLKWTTPF